MYILEHLEKNKLLSHPSFASKEFMITASGDDPRIVTPQIPLDHQYRILQAGLCKGWGSPSRSACLKA
jgi:hypothetical protein